MNPLRLFALPGAVVLAGLAYAVPAQASVQTDTEGDVATLRAAASKYQDVTVAVKDGYVPTDDCVSSPDGKGVMGYHYVNPKLLGAPAEVAKPPILVYQPDSSGGRKLVAAEYFKPDADQDLATKDDKPTLFGKPFDGPMEGHSPEMPKHYDLHAWLWQDNPAGMFADYNPAGSCKVTAAAASSAPSSGASSSASSSAESFEGATTGQVSKLPVGGADTGGGSAAAATEPWLVGLGIGATAAGLVLFAAASRAGRGRL